MEGVLVTMGMIHMYRSCMATKYSWNLYLCMWYTLIWKLHSFERSKDSFWSEHSHFTLLIVAAFGEERADRLCCHA